MRPDRSWMRRRKNNNGQVTEEFKNGVDEFIEVSKRHPRVVDALGRIFCPCSKCKNCVREQAFWVEKHLYEYGFMEDYLNWTVHGEDQWGNSSSTDWETRNPYVDMVIDSMDDDDLSEDQNLEEDPNLSASKFYTLLRDADEPLWDGCQRHTKLSAVTQLLNLKSEYNMSESCYDRMIAIIKSMLPESEKLPENFYRSKKMVTDLTLGYEKIDACPNHCMLYDKENKDPKICSACLVCGHPRFKQKVGCLTKEKDVPFSVLRYFPIIPRLQRLYMSKYTAQYMCWHADGVRHDKTVITHPADAKAWKQFDVAYPRFAEEPRNVRLGLCTDGFNPFGFSGTQYSCWPVFVTPYNLPPSMCMRREYIFLSLLIPGPKSPGKSLDVYLRPLIDELKILWEDGVNTFDACKRQNFKMKATLLWTISDFPAYGMLSGWSTHGKLACPYCMGKSKSFVLECGKKCCWFDCHRQYLPLDHPFRRDRNSFKISKIEKSLPPLRLTGIEIMNRVNHLKDFIFGLNSHNKKQNGFGKDHNWVKKSIFWELPYWSTNLIRHNLDVMHVEKNVFDNIFNTIMDIKGKTKDNANAREDMKMICKRPTLELIVDNGKHKKPKATYVLSDNQRKMVYGWIKQLKFPDGYVSNISRCINLKDGKVYGMKSHDCHVFMQRLIPLALRDMLPKPIWRALTELSLFFKEICATELRESVMEKAELSIIEIVCKLEKIFPPAFFDVMEHLVVHLPYEAKVGGPVQYRWMYPFERCMLYLKRKVRNKAKVEGSICEAYILEEISNFASMYFDPNLQTRRTKVPRNDDGGNCKDYECLSIFKYPCRPIGRGRNRFLTDDELHIAETYVLVNCKEVEPFLQKFEDSLRETYFGITNDQILELRDKDFIGWIKQQVIIGQVEDQVIRTMSYGPSKSVTCYNGIIVNGYRFHTKEYGKNKATINSGVCVRGSIYGENDLDYYDIIEEILELSYLGAQNKVLLLRCHWFDPINGVKVDERYGLVDVKPKSKLNSNDPFVLASQAQQVYYTMYPHNNGRGKEDWWAACKVRRKLFIAESFNNEQDDMNKMDAHDYYQDDGSFEANNVVIEEEAFFLFDTNSPMKEVDINDIYIYTNKSSIY